MQCVKQIFALARPAVSFLSFNLKSPILGSMWQPQRPIFLSAIHRLKEIQVQEAEDSIQVKGVMIPSPREDFFVKTPHDDQACPLCRLNLDIKHTDVLILSQFLRTDGCMLPQRLTGLCKRQQKRVSKMVKMAQKAGLMPNLNPPGSKMNPKLRYGWKKYNKYFDEATLEVKVIKKGTWWKPKANVRRGFHPYGGIK